MHPFHQHIVDQCSKLGVASFTDGYCVRHVAHAMYALFKGGNKVMSARAATLAEHLEKRGVKVAAS